jgi:hypothetical protein
VISSLQQEPARLGCDAKKSPRLTQTVGRRSRQRLPEAAGDLDAIVTEVRKADAYGAMAVSGQHVAGFSISERQTKRTLAIVLARVLGAVLTCPPLVPRTPRITGSLDAAEAR